MSSSSTDRFHTLSKFNPHRARRTRTTTERTLRPGSSASGKHDSASCEANVFRFAGFCILYSLSLSIKIHHFFSAQLRWSLLIPSFRSSRSWVERGKVDLLCFSRWYSILRVSGSFRKVCSESSCHFATRCAQVPGICRLSPGRGALCLARFSIQHSGSLC